MIQRIPARVSLSSLKSRFDRWILPCSEHARTVKSRKSQKARPRRIPDAAARNRKRARAPYCSRHGAVTETGAVFGCSLP